MAPRSNSAARSNRIERGLDSGWPKRESTRDPPRRFVGQLSALLHSERAR